MPRPPPPSGKFLPIEIRALRAVIDSLGTSSFPRGDPRDQKTRAAVEREDFFERTYPVLWVLARHGIEKTLAVSALWTNLSVEKKALKLANGSLVLLDDQDVADLKNLLNRYPYPNLMKYMVGSSVWPHHINARVMERWACRADLRRDPVRYEDFVLGFAALGGSVKLRPLVLPGANLTRKGSL